MHQLQHQVAALEARPRVVEVAGAVAIRAGEQSHEKGRLADIQIARGLAEIELSGLLKPLGPEAEIGAIEIELEDLVLAEAHLQLERHRQLPELAGQAQVPSHLRINHAGDLLGQAAAATAPQHRRAQRAE